MAIKLLIFDVGGVLIDFNETMYTHFLHEEVLPGIDEYELFKFIYPLISVMEYGKLSVPELEGMLSKHFHKDKLDIQWVQGWKRIAKPKMSVISLLNKLHARYPVVLLSNVSKSRYAEMKRSFLKLAKFDRIYASWELEMRKPDPRIYHYVLDKEKVKPSEAVFVDNQIENVIGAEKEGIRSIWFRDYKRLDGELKALGVSTSSDD